MNEMNVLGAVFLLPIWIVAMAYSKYKSYIKDAERIMAMREGHKAQCQCAACKVFLFAPR